MIGRTLLALAVVVTMMAGATQAELTLSPLPDRFPSLPWEKRSDWRDVRSDFAAHAKGDGIADDTAALQAALDALRDGTTVYIPPGTYRITQSLEPKVPQPGFGSVRIVGHGSATRIVWDGAKGGRMLVIRGCYRTRYTGIVWDGRGVAAVGVSHDATRFETEVTHEHEAFLNFTQAGIQIEPTHKTASAEISYRSCLFQDCGKGVSFQQFNDYDNTFNGCEFIRCGVGIEDVHGNFYARNCRFEGSRVVDISSASEHGSSVRRCISVGSKAFLQHQQPVAPMTVENCTIDGWTDTNGAIRLGGALVILMDCSFTRPPDAQAPVVSLGGDLHLVISGNRIEKGGKLLRNPEAAAVTEVPPGAVKPAAVRPDEYFITRDVQIAGKVFDAKRDFGAKGDGKTDDTQAISDAIAAARAYGRNSIAYLPTGVYVVSRTIQMDGADYRFGGGGFLSRLLWQGAPGGTVLAVRSPRNLTLENISIGDPDTQMTNGADVEQVGSDSPSTMTYDGVWVFGMYQKQAGKKGLHLAGLGKNDLVHIRQMTGNIRIDDSGDAQIIADVTYEGTVSIGGKKGGRDGITGFLTRLGTITAPPLEVRDSQSVVMSDFYIEQADNCLMISGDAGDKPGRITFQGAKMEAHNGPITIKGYNGDVMVGHTQLYLHPEQAMYLVDGAHSSLALVANMFYDAVPNLRATSGGHIYPVGCAAVSSKGKAPVVKAEDASGTAIVARGFDDLRRLGQLDRKVNFDR